MRKRWNGTPVTRIPRVDFTVELLERLGASGKSLAALGKELGISPQLISRHINKSVTNRNAYEKGRLKTNGTNECIS